MFRRIILTCVFVLMFGCYGVASEQEQKMDVEALEVKLSAIVWEYKYHQERMKILDVEFNQLQSELKKLSPPVAQPSSIKKKQSEK